MSRNGGGVYSLPGTYEATPGETILAEQHNDPLEDLEQDANTARPIVAGGTGAITAIAAHDNFSTKGADVASAATTDIGAATGSYIHITGTTGITALGTKTAGVLRDVVFDGILTLTHSGTLILPGGANITTAAGDTAELISEGGGTWRMTRYTYANTATLRSAIGVGYATAAEKTTFLTNLGAAFDCGTAYLDSGAIKFAPYRGNLVNLGVTRAVKQIPDTALSLSSSGTSANTTYYVYVWDSNADGVLDSIEYSTTAPVYVDGIRVKNGDSTSIFVAIARTNATPAWSRVRSWFNRTPAVASSIFTATRTVSSLAYAEVNTEIRQTVLALEGDILDATFESSVNMGAGGNRGGWGIIIDGVVASHSLTEIVPDGSGAYPTFGRRLEALTEGVHTLSVSAIVSANTLSFRQGSTSGGYPVLKSKLGL